jgi:putative ABC transport system permease protein
VRADFIVQGTNYGSLPADTLGRIRGVGGVQTVAGLDIQQVQVNKKLASIDGIDPRAFASLWRFDWLGGGSDALLGQLGTGNALLEEQTASTLGLKTGQSFVVTTADGQRASFKVIGRFKDPMLLNGIVVSSAGFKAVFSQPQLYMAFVTGSGGTSGRELGAIKAALADVPTAEVKTIAEYKDGVVKQVNQLLNLLYGLLVMSVVISLFGIVNTLVLAVYERTREIGLTRAIGMSRSQVRATVRYESVITSVIGAIMGIVVGVVFAWVVTTRFAGQGITFSIPGVQLVVFLILAIVVGVIAAILPARRAAKIDILEAIHYE